MGCVQSKCTSDVSVGLEKMKIARNCLESERGALEEEKLKMEKEREKNKTEILSDDAFNLIDLTVLNGLIG